MPLNKKYAVNKFLAYHLIFKESFLFFIIKNKQMKIIIETIKIAQFIKNISGKITIISSYLGSNNQLVLPGKKI